MHFRIDRRKRLLGYDSEELRRFLLLAPEFESLAFTPRLQQQHFGYPRIVAVPKAVSTVTELASMADSREGVGAILAGLDRDAVRLAILAGWFDGELSRPQALRQMSAGESEDQHTAQQISERFDAAADRLELLLVAELRPSAEGGVLTVPNDVTSLLKIPGIRLQDRFNETTSDEMHRWLYANGRTAVGTRKDQRIEELQGLFSDPEHVELMRAGLSEAAKAIFDRLVRSGGPVPVDEFGIGFGSRAPMQHRRYVGAQLFGELDDRGLVGFDPYTREIWLWREIVKARGAQVFDRWGASPKPIFEPLDGDGRTLAFGAIAMVESVARYWSRNPPPALTDGSIGVASVKAAAKALKLDPTTVGVATHLLVADDALKLAVTGMNGRGRNRIPIYEWQINSGTPISRPEAVAESRWLAMVASWLSLTSINESEGLPNRFSTTSYAPTADGRRIVLRVLESLPVATGAADFESFVGWISDQHHLLLEPELVRGIVQGAMLVGLVTTRTPFGLTDLARQLLSGHTFELGSPVDAIPRVIVQSDLSVVVPQDTAPETVARIARIAELESDAGARIYRLSERQISEAIEDSFAVDEIISFLQKVSTTGVPQPVEYFVRDVDRRRGRLVVAQAQTVITSTDPALLVEASRVKGAGLQLISPHTAISDLPARKVQQLLDEKGLLPIFRNTEPNAEAKPVSTLRPAHHSLTRIGRAESEVLAQGTIDVELAYASRQETIERAEKLKRK